MRKQVEILVVGAGPAGSTLARELVEQGRDVVLVEKMKLPRHKPCGGGLPQRTLNLLPEACMPEQAGRVRRVRLVGAWKGDLEFDLPDSTECLVVDRGGFDRQLALRAEQAGAVLVQDCELKAIRHQGRGFLAATSKGEIHARVVAACDGVFSPVARAFGFAVNDLGFCLETIVKIPENLQSQINATAIFYLGCVKDGYGWSFPREHEFAVGLGVARSKAPELSDDLRKMLCRIPELESEKNGKARGGMLPDFKGPRALYAREKAYLVGDAAGLVDPLTGEGIFYAIRSAQLAARAIMGDGESEYQALLEQELLPELMAALRIAKRFRGTPVWLRGLLMSLPGFRKRMRDFVDILCGSSGYTRKFSSSYKG